METSILLSAGVGGLAIGYLSFSRLSAIDRQVAQHFFFTKVSGLGTAKDLRRNESSLANGFQDLFNETLLWLVIGALLIASSLFLGATTFSDARNLVSPFSSAMFGFGIGASAAAIASIRMVHIDRTRFHLFNQVQGNFLAALPESDFRDTELRRQIQRARAREMRDRNLASTFELKQVRLKTAVLFTDITWILSPGINILLGRNGYGKSYLLRLLVGLLSYENDRLADLLGADPRSLKASVKLLRDGNLTEVSHADGAFDQSFGKVPALAIPDSRFIDRSTDTVGGEADKYADLALHGTHRFLHNLPFETTVQTVLTQMCIDAGSDEWLKDYPESPQIRMVEQVMYKLAGERFRFRRITPIGQARFRIEVESHENPLGPITIQQASQGTLSVVFLFLVVFQFLHDTSKQRSANDEIDRRRAIVLVDEIDAHLHPIWQRKIVHLLRKQFPNVQFVLTAHSPLVVAGCSHSEVSRLERQEGGFFTLRMLSRHFVGTPITEIYRDIFDVGPHDDAFLELFAMLPIVHDLEQELSSLRRAKPPDQVRIKRLEDQLTAINRAGMEEQESIDVNRLRLQNEQLKRQLIALRERKNRAPQDE